MRYVFAVIGLVVIIGGLAGVKYAQISNLMKMGKEMQAQGPPPEAVSSSVAQEQTWEGTLSAVGTIAAAKGVAVSNDSPGTIARIDFESGEVVRAGQVLVELDTSVERAQLASAAARRDLAKVSAGRSRALVSSGSISASQLDSDEAQLKTSAADLGALEAQIDRKIVRAPFAGRLGIRMVNLGQYLNPGTTVAVLEAIDTVFVDFSLPQQRLSDVKVGTPVRLTLDNDSYTAQGSISAVDPSVDAVTRTLKLRASIPNKEEKLRPGMFVNVAVVLPDIGKVVAVPATAVVHAPYGDSVFAVEDPQAPDGGEAPPPVQDKQGRPIKSARQQFVKLGDARGDFVAIVDGVKAGQEVVSAGAFKLRNGAHIVLVPDVKPKPELNPHPENH